ncbi:MAG: D-2-hydroxyacid dehydrogenase [Phycisphaeraceae bacterium]|nr:D-2-hydroxyacid dehydrogenase [Phycisphaeraceae bacterium]
MKPPIVVLDGHALNPGDLSWQPLAALGELTVHPRTAPADILARAAGAPYLLTNKTPLLADTLAQLPQARYIGVLATGVNVVDLAAARRGGISVTNVPAYSSASVAQHVFAMLLELVSRAAAHDQAVHQGRWVASPDFSFTVAPITELADKIMGIVGYGAIGRRVAAIAQALGMRVVAAVVPGSPAQAAAESRDVARWPLDDLLAQADVVSLHCPLTDQTRHLINAPRLAFMKPTAYLINTGRGPLVDEPALAAALRENRLAGAGLDVLSAEPPPADNPLLSAPRCLITPHVAWASVEARRRLLAAAADNLRAFLAGQPINVVN